MRWLIAVGFLAGCVSSNSNVCGDGTLCPDHSVCATITTDPASTMCVDQSQLDACAPLHDHAHCSTTDIPVGRCYDGVCLADQCGNGRLDGPDPMDPSDTGETCDDGNQRPDDGCSSDCKSDETCGNGIVDLVKAEQCDDGNHVDHDGCDATCNSETVRWSVLHAIDPSTRYSSAMAYDRERGQTVMFGGLDASTGEVLGDTWVWDGNGWLEVSPATSPPPRYAHAMAYDAKRKRVVLYGGIIQDPGGGGLTTSGEVWEWDGAHWIPNLIPPLPGARSDHAMTYDEDQQRVILYGGRLVGQGAVAQSQYDRGDTWSYDGTSWTKIADTGPTPAAFSSSGYFGGGGRSEVAMTYDSQRKKVVLVGGTTTYVRVVCSPSCFRFVALPLADSDAWELDATGWHDVSMGATNPPLRKGAALAYDPVGHRSVLFSGEDGTDTPIADEWAWDGTMWTNPTPTLPPARGYHGMVTDTLRGRIVVAEGHQTDPDPTTWDVSTWELAPGDTWTSTTTPVPVTAQPPFTTSPIGAYDPVRGVEVVVDTTGATYELGATSWKLVGNTGAQYSSIALAYDRDLGKTVLVAVDNTTSTSTTMLWDGASWTQPPGLTTPGLDYMRMTYDEKRKEVVLVGTASGFLQQYRFNGTWSQVQTTLPSPDREFFGLAYDPARAVVVLYGGGFSLQPMSDTWLWDGTAWTQSTSPGAGGRSAPTLAWNPVRQRVFLAGGADQTVWEWDGSAWTMIEVPVGPLPRQSPIVMPTRDGTGMRIYGGQGAQQLIDLWELAWDTGKPFATCDGAASCTNPDCFATCAPLCEPDASYATCEATANPRCGDGTCGAVETCISCPEDCGACP